jgi:hypothetical protein
MSVQDMCTGAETVVPAALRGYRTWGTRGNGELLSLLPYEWSLGEQVARCLVPVSCPCYGCFVYARRHGERSAHSAPGADCGCGFYGWYSPVDSRLMDGPVFGAVEVSGRVLMGTHGFRAERARVLGLVVDEGARSPASLALRRRAEVSLVPVFSSRAALLEQLPPDDVSSLVDHSCDHRCVVGPPPYGSVLAPFMAALTQATSSTAAEFAKAASEKPEPDPDPVPESPRERAMSLRRDRNTGRRGPGRFLSRVIRPTGGAR